jgi:hypothetical protein
LYGPAPPGIPGIPLPGFGVGTAPPPPSASFMEMMRNKKRRFSLRRARAGE